MYKNNFLKRFLTILLLLVLSVTMTVQASSTSKTDKAEKTEKTEKTEKAENTTLSEAQKEMNELREQLKKAEGLVDELKDSKGDIESKISSLNRSLINISARITELENQLWDKNAQIADTLVQLDIAKAVADKQYADMKLRIQYMYENRQFSYAETLLASENLSEFLNSAEYIKRIQQYDRDKLDQYKNTIAEIEAFEQQLEQERAELEALKTDVESEKKRVATVMAAKETELAGIKSELSDAQDEAEIIEAEIQAQEELIAEIIRIQAEKEAAGKGDSAYEGVFTWPVPDSKRVTSDFGPRNSPTAGASSNHKGIDIGAPTGSDIVAVAPGKVIVSRYSSSAGYYITIDHGGGLYSVYMHCSKLLKDYGDVVAGGELIAKVGSTGISTGPHLHFGVSLNGTYVSPWGYLKKP